MNPDIAQWMRENLRKSTRDQIKNGELVHYPYVSRRRDWIVMKTKPVFFKRNKEFQPIAALVFRKKTRKFRPITEKLMNKVRNYRFIRKVL